MQKFNRKDLVELVSEGGHLSKKDARVAIDIVFENIEKALLEGQEVNITNFGVFVPKRKMERIGTDPKKHSLITIKAKNTITFRVCKQLRAKLNK